MKYGTVGKVLAGIGALLMLRAMTMSVVGGSFDGVKFANLSLMNERSNTLMLGGVLLVVGVILYSVFKLKQTKEEEMEDQRRDLDALAQAKVFATHTYNTATKKASEIPDAIVSTIGSITMTGIGNFVGRLFAGLLLGSFCGVVLSWIGWTLISNIFSGAAYVAVVGLIVLGPTALVTFLAFRKGTTGTLLVRLVVGVSLGALWGGLLSGATYLALYFYSDNTLLSEGYAAIVICLTAALTWYTVHKGASSRSIKFLAISGVLIPFIVAGLGPFIVAGLGR